MSSSLLGLKTHPGIPRLLGQTLSPQHALVSTSRLDLYFPLLGNYNEAEAVRATFWYLVGEYPGTEAKVFRGNFSSGNFSSVFIQPRSPYFNQRYRRIWNWSNAQSASTDHLTDRRFLTPTIPLNAVRITISFKPWFDLSCNTCKVFKGTRETFSTFMGIHSIQFF